MSPGLAPPSSAIPLYDLGRVPYRAALAFQHRAVELRSQGGSPDVLYVCEHEPVLTVGRSGHAESLRASAPELARRGIEVVPVERGGDVTYHGPGQIIGYPIVSLDGLPGGRDLHRYLRDLEQGLIDCLAAFGIAAGRRPPYTGVWVGDRKVAAIGVAVRRWVAFHGFALNLDPDLSHFDLIHPCGIRDLGVASMRSLIGRAPSRELVLARLAWAFARIWERPVTYPAPLESIPCVPFPSETAHV
jgi:lipoyl(octanoyl) transferase